MQEVSAYVALGSNVGNRAAHLDAAVARLAATAGVELGQEAPRYETEPVGGPPQAAFLNGALGLKTSLAAEVLLARLHAIEAEAGRTRDGEANGPRTLDLDLLFYGDAIIEEPGLVVPHPRLHERSFVLDPLCDIAPELVHPVLGVSIRELALRVREGEPGTASTGCAEAAGRAWQS